MKFSWISAPAVALAAVAFLSGCPVNEPAPPVERDVSFSMEIQPIFNELCAKCHSEGGFAVTVGIPLLLTEGDAHGQLVNQPSVQDPAFTLVVPSDAATSLLYQKVSDDSPPVGSTMPLFSERLTSEELGLIRDWIEQGAQDN